MVVDPVLCFPLQNNVWSTYDLKPPFPQSLLFCRMKLIAILLITCLAVLVESYPLMMTKKNRLSRRNNDKYSFWNGGRSSPITYIHTLPSSFNNGLLNLFGIRKAQKRQEERSNNGDSIANR